MILFIFCTVSHLPGQAQSQKSEPLAGILTTAHRHVPLSQYSLVLPDTSFGDFYYLNGALTSESDIWNCYLQFMTVPQSVEDMTEVFNGDPEYDFITSRFVILQKQLIHNNAQHGMIVKTMMTAEEENNMDSAVTYTLFLGDDSSSVILTISVTQKTDSLLQNNIKHTFSSLAIDTIKYADAFAGLQFHLDTAGTGLMYANNGNGMIIFKAVKEPTVNAHKDIFLAISAISIDALLTEENKQNIVKARASYFDMYEIQEFNAVNIGGLTGYEAVSKDKDSSGMIYSMYLYDKETCYQFYGVFTAPGSSAIESFRKFAVSFQLN